MYYTVYMAVVNYFGTQMPEIENIDGHMLIETADVYKKDLNNPKKPSDSNCKIFSGGII